MLLSREHVVVFCRTILSLHFILTPCQGSLSIEDDRRSIDEEGIAPTFEINHKGSGDKLFVKDKRLTLHPHGPTKADLEQKGQDALDRPSNLYGVYREENKNNVPNIYEKHISNKRESHLGYQKEYKDDKPKTVQRQNVANSLFNNENKEQRSEKMKPFSYDLTKLSANTFKLRILSPVNEKSIDVKDTDAKIHSSASPNVIQRQKEIDEKTNNELVETENGKIYHNDDATTNTPISVNTPEEIRLTENKAVFKEKNPKQNSKNVNSSADKNRLDSHYKLMRIQRLREKRRKMILNSKLRKLPIDANDIHKKKISEQEQRSQPQQILILSTFNAKAVTLSDLNLKRTERMLSDMITMHPFISPTRAHDYLVSFDKVKRPRRWPLRYLVSNEESKAILNDGTPEVSKNEAIITIKQSTVLNVGEQGDEKDKTNLNDVTSGITRKNKWKNTTKKSNGTVKLNKRKGEKKRSKSRLRKRRKSPKRKRKGKNKKTKKHRKNRKNGKRKKSKKSRKKRKKGKNRRSRNRRNKKYRKKKRKGYSTSKMKLPQVTRMKAYVDASDRILNTSFVKKSTPANSPAFGLYFSPEPKIKTSEILYPNTTQPMMTLSKNYSQPSGNNYIYDLTHQNQGEVLQNVNIRKTNLSEMHDLAPLQSQNTTFVDIHHNKTNDILETMFRNYSVSEDQNQTATNQTKSYHYLKSDINSLEDVLLTPTPTEIILGGFKNATNTVTQLNFTTNHSTAEMKAINSDATTETKSNANAPFTFPKVTVLKSRPPLKITLAEEPSVSTHLNSSFVETGRGIPASNFSGVSNGTSGKLVSLGLLSPDVASKKTHYNIRYTTENLVTGHNANPTDYNVTSNGNSKKNVSSELLPPVLVSNKTYKIEYPSEKSSARGGTNVSYYATTDSISASFSAKPSSIPLALSNGSWRRWIKRQSKSFNKKGNHRQYHHSRNKKRRKNPNRRSGSMSGLVTRKVNDNSVTQPQRSTTTKSPFVTYKSAHDFLSRNHRPVNSEAYRESRELNAAMAEKMCKVFGKRFVPSSIGGRCV